MSLLLTKPSLSSQSKHHSTLAGYKLLSIGGLNIIFAGQLSVFLSCYHSIVRHYYACKTQYMVRMKERVVRKSKLAGLKLQEKDLEKLVVSPVGPSIVCQDLDVL